MDDRDHRYKILNLPDDAVALVRVLQGKHGGYGVVTVQRVIAADESNGLALALYKAGVELGNV